MLKLCPLLKRGLAHTGTEICCWNLSSIRTFTTSVSLSSAEAQETRRQLFLECIIITCIDTLHDHFLLLVRLFPYSYSVNRINQHMQISVQKLPFRHFIVSSVPRVCISSFRRFAFSLFRLFSELCVILANSFYYTVILAFFYRTRKSFAQSPTSFVSCMNIFFCTRRRELTCNSDVGFKASCKQIVHSVFARCLPGIISC